MKYRYLVVSDTNNIIDYIYASPKFKMIRGASILLDELNIVETVRIAEEFGGLVLSTGGGEARVLFERKEDAEGYMTAIQRKYLEATDEVSLSIVNVERREHELMHDWLQRAEERLRLSEIAKYKKKIHNISIAPIMKRCDSCHQRAAEKGLEVEEMHCCRSCYNKKKAFDGLKEKIDSPKFSDQDGDLSGLEEVYQQLIKEVPFQRVEKMSDLVGDEPSDSFIGFIYADGKGIGQLFKGDLERETDDETFIRRYKEISKGLKDSLISAAVEAYKKCLEIGFEEEEFRVDFSSIGGDDFAAIINGKHATVYTYYLLKYFNLFTKNKINLKAGKHLAAGIIIAKSTYPIHQLYNLAYELMAKTKAESNESTLDFQILYDSNITSIDEKRMNIDGRDLYVRTYRIGDSDDQHLSFKDLYEKARKLKERKFPSSKIKAIYRITAEPSKLMMEFEWREWLSRLEKEHKEIFFEWNKKFRKTPFAFERNGIPYTPLRDLFDLYEFVDEKVVME
ncbi:Cas10/Cmr2 second palm domain-containing protein [Ureibacillus terrenus]|uniref:Cas10/Cmr2 second palm domain-containing protein n=1 Tax=Ureibacillus terrenus TaxID=118246 RepID=UPI002E1E735F|nr:hypothetical protein [Ureibacillus terrenus]